MDYQIKEVLSNGVALGRVRTMEISYKNYKYSSSDGERKLLRKGISKSLDQILKLKIENPELNEYLTIQETIMNDPVLINKAFEKIDAGLNAIEAISAVMKAFVDGLDNSSSTYLKQRNADLYDVSFRIANNIYSNKTIDKTDNFILVVDELYPSYLISHRPNILGVIAKKGGYTSHSSIICRSLDIPFVLSDNEYDFDDTIIIDTRISKIIVNPDETALDKYNKVIDSLKNENKRAIRHPGFRFYANIATIADVDRVLKYNFDGIGLFRTEMIFMNTNRGLTFEEQTHVYKKVVTLMGNKPVTFRTFDIGDDKHLSYVRAFKKGVDNYHHNKELFETQVLAILASANRHTKLMFPMIETVDEYYYLKAWVKGLALEHNFKCNLKIGMMLETKKALENIEDFKEVDFMSIGTNDLSAELYNVKRDEAYDQLKTYSDDLAEKLKKVVDFCNEYGIELSICGELASIKEAALGFYSLGIKNLSVSPSAIQSLNTAYKEYKRINKN